MRVTDGDWVLQDYDFATGRQVWSMRNPDGSVTMRTDTPVDATIEANKAQKNLAQSGWKGDYHHIASIPLNLLHDQLVTAHSQGDDKYVSRWLNDPDNAAWRTKSGRV